MKNLRQVLYMLFLLAPISTIASSPFSKLTIKPNLSISLNKRSLKGLTEQALQTGDSKDSLFNGDNGELAAGYQEPVSFQDRAFMFVADPFGHIANTDANGCFLYYGQDLALRCSDSKPILQNTWKQSSVGAPGLVFIETDVPGTGWIGDMVRDENINLYQFKPGTGVYNEYRYSFNNEWRLKKAGSDEIADESHAIVGSRIVFVGDNENTGISKQKGRYRLPVLGLGEAPQNSNFTGTALRLYTVNYDKLTDDANEFTWGEPAGTTFSLDQSANRHGPDITDDPQGTNFLEFAQYQGGSVNKLVFYPQTYAGTTNSLVHKDLVERPKTYLKPSDYNASNATKKYYGILIAGPDVGFSTNYSAVLMNQLYGSDTVDWSPTKGALWENNFKRLQETPVLAKKDGTDTYTQVDHEQIDYYGIDLELAIDYEVAEFIHILGKSSVSAPVEKIEHTGKFISLKPEATIALRGGVTLGNRNGSIGFLYGFAYDRYKTVVKNFERSGSDVDATGEDSDTGAYQHVSIVSNKATIKDFVTNREIIANINLSDKTSAFFSTVLSDKKYNVDVPGLTDASALTQKYALGISLNY